MDSRNVEEIVIAPEKGQEITVKLCNNLDTLQCYVNTAKYLSY